MLAMNAHDVVELYVTLERAGVRVWIDGGWSVDAALGRESRPHGDLDIAIEASAVGALRAIMAARGYTQAADAAATDWNFVLTDGAGRKVDVHAVVFAASGDAILGRAERGHKYPAGALDGMGRIAGADVRCVAPAFMVQFKTGYPPRDIDRTDVQALCRHLGLAVPASHR
jgi:lincosamide nucleotidyltransferase A/C/D/E